MLITKKLTIDLANWPLKREIYAVQCDSNTRAVAVTLMAAGVPWTPPEGAAASVAFSKPDGNKGWYDQLPDGTMACTVADNVVTAILAPEVLTAPGRVNAAIVFQDADLNQISTFSFVIEVEPNPAAGNVISNSYYKYSTMADVNAAIASLERAIVNGEFNGEALDAVLYTEQTLTDAQKAQARENIGAADKTTANTLNDRVSKVEGQLISENPIDISSWEWVNGYFGPGGGTLGSSKYIRFAGDKPFFVAGTRITLADGYDGYINFYTGPGMSTNVADERLVFSNVGNDYVLTNDRYVAISICYADKTQDITADAATSLTIYEKTGRVDEMQTDLAAVKSRVESLIPQAVDHAINRDSLQTMSVESVDRLMDALSDLQAGTTHPSITIRIPNKTGAVIPNATARLSLHKGVQEGEAFWNEIFSENFRDNFAGLRFFDGDVNLPYVIQSSGNYDFVKDASIGTTYVGRNVKDTILHDSAGVLYKRVEPGVIARSTNNGSTWEPVVDKWDCYPRFIDSKNRMFIQTVENLPDTATAEEYDATVNYACGAIVSCNGVIYKCKSQSGATGSWNSSNWLTCDGLSRFYMIPQKTDGTYDQDTAVLVLDLSHMMEFIDSSIARWGEDAAGSIFMGRYQTTWVGAAVYRMAADETAFTLVCEDTSTQHTHHITIDRHHTPNIIYASFDNSNTAYGPIAVQSLDGGTTWEQVPVPYRNRDFALKYIGPDFALGGGEANVLGGETLYRTTDVMNPDKYETVIATHQGIRDLFTPDGGKTILCDGVGANGNRTEQLYMSTDKGLTWKTVYANEIAPIPGSVGDGVRVFTDYFTPAGANEAQVIANGNGRTYGLRCYFGGDRHYALVYVNIGDLPAEGKDITLDLNYLTDNSSMEDTVDPNIIEPVFWLPLNEGCGTMVRTGTNYEKLNLSDVLDRWVTADGLYYTGMLPAKTASDYGIILKDCGAAEVGKIPIDRIDDFSLSFWLRVPDDTTDILAYGPGNFDKTYLLTSDNIDIYLQGKAIGFRFGDLEVVNSFAPMNWRTPGHWRKFMLTVSAANNDGLPTLTEYIYDGEAKGVKTATVWGTGLRFSDQVFSLGSATEKNLPYGIADIRFYDRCLTAEEAIAVQHGRRYAQVGQSY